MWRKAKGKLIRALANVSQKTRQNKNNDKTPENKQKKIFPRQCSEEKFNTAKIFFHSMGFLFT